jgi:hypothetical protein
MRYEPEKVPPILPAGLTCQHLTRSIEMHNAPQGLIAYWNQEKNWKRRQLLSDDQRQALDNHFQQHLEALNNAGPY